MSEISQSPAQLPTINAPVIFEQHGSLYTNSLSVATCFDKQHRHVLRDIESLIAACPDNFNAPNFGLVEYTDAKGEKRPMYNLTFDGFILLAMGYTGPKALQVKLAYIAEFNRMKAILERKKIEAVTPAGLAPKQQAELKALADAKCSNYPAAMQRKVRGELWTRFNRRFCIASYSQLPPDQMDEARGYIIDMELKCAPKPVSEMLEEDMSNDELKRLLAYTIGNSNGWKKAFEALFDKMRLG